MATMPLAAWLLIAACLGALAAALVGQYFFDMAPCILCYYQRVPYGLVAALAAGMLFLCRNPKLDRLLLGLCALLFLIGAGTAFFHSGVERLWWGGTPGCGVQPLDKPASQISIEEMRQRLLETPVVRCDVIDWTLFGLTLANLNIFAFLGLSAFSLLAAAIAGGASAGSGSCSCCCRKKE
jgi:disulfide bond formation protein DsbB